MRSAAIPLSLIKHGRSVLSLRDTHRADCPCCAAELAEALSAICSAAEAPAAAPPTDADSLCTVHSILDDGTTPDAVTAAKKAARRLSEGETQRASAELMAHELRNALLPVQMAVSGLFRALGVPGQADPALETYRDRMEAGLDRTFRFIAERLRATDSPAPVVTIPPDPQRWAVYYPNEAGKYQAEYAATEGEARARAARVADVHAEVYDRHDGLAELLRLAPDRQSGESLLRAWSHNSQRPAGRLNELADLLDQLHPVNKAVDHGE